MGRPGSKIEGRRANAVPVRSVADLDAAEAPVITIPEALANETAARGRTFHIHRRTAIISIGRRWGRAGRDGSADDGAANQSASNGSTEVALRARGCRSERGCDRCNRDEGNK